MLHIAYRASGKIYGRRFATGTVFFLKILWKPVCPVFTVARPNVTLCSKCFGHHFKGRKGHPLFFIDKFAAQFHPGWLYGQRRGTAQITELTGCTYQKSINLRLIPFGPSFQLFPQPIPLAARTLALPATAVKLITLLHTVTALRTTVRIPNDIRRDVR